jgi:hypothetical protein
MKRFLVVIVVLLIFTACAKRESKYMLENIRQPAVAGQFYPADADGLKSMIDGYLDEVKTSPTPLLGKEGNIRAIMAPHAGYVFSGSVAAYGYKRLEGQKVDTVVIICNSHTAYFEGIAIDDNDAWKTPLGEVEVDKELAERLVNADSSIKYNNAAHKDEHSLEVQLPFLQIVLSGNFKIVPILFGNTYDDGYKKLAAALAENLGENDLVVISTDMSHYPSYEDANRIDKETLEKIKFGNILELERHIKKVESESISNEQTLLCGIDGVKTIMSLADGLNWTAEVLKYANSGDTPYGDKESVVGYGAIVYTQIQSAKFKAQNNNSKFKNNLLNDAQKQELLNIAKIAVENYVRDGKIPEFKVEDERLNWKEGGFVTLREDGKLRGCIGQIAPSNKPLWQVVRDMAIAAATEDDRFNPVSVDELEKLDYEISVLSAPQKIDNWHDIELGKHGVIIRKGTRGGVFLPQVAQETGWSLGEFLSQLCFQKAGLPADCYKDDDVELSVFTAQVF